MALSLRFYLFEEGSAPKVLSRRLVEGLINGTEYLPQYADTRQRVLDVVLENVDGQPQSITGAEGTFFQFDKEGGIREALQESLREVMNFVDFSPQSEGKVVALKPSIDRKRFQAKHRWQPTEDELRVVTADIWPTAKVDRLGKVVASPRPPKLTYEARNALDECSKNFWSIDHEIDRLTEPGLKGFAHEARSRAKDESRPELYEALARMADRRLQVLAARRKKNGVWFAWVSLIKWDESHVGEEVGFFHERCQGREDAEAAAASLLRKHAESVAYNVSVEAGVETELEWRQEHAGWPEDS